MEESIWNAGYCQELSFEIEARWESSWKDCIICTCHNDEMTEFIGDIRWIIHRRTDFSMDQFAETRAQPMDGDFHGGLGQAE